MKGYKVSDKQFEEIIKVIDEYYKLTNKNGISKELYDKLYTFFLLSGCISSNTYKFLEQIVKVTK